MGVATAPWGKKKTKTKKKRLPPGKTDRIVSEHKSPYITSSGWLLVLTLTHCLGFRLSGQTKHMTALAGAPRVQL